MERITQIIIADEAEGMDEDTLGIALSKGESINKSEKGHGKMGRYGLDKELKYIVGKTIIFSNHG